MSASVKRPAPRRSPDIEKGQALAIQFLVDLENRYELIPGCYLAREVRNAGRYHRYENRLFQHLQKARQQGSEVEQGFTMILNDFIASICESSLANSRYYTRLLGCNVQEDAS